MKIETLRVTRTFYYGADDYLEWCEEQEVEPTQEGFLEFISDSIFDDFDSCLEDLREVSIEQIGGDNEEQQPMPFIGDLVEADIQKALKKA